MGREGKNCFMYMKISAEEGMMMITLPLSLCETFMYVDEKGIMLRMNFAAEACCRLLDPETNPSIVIRVRFSVGWEKVGWVYWKVIKRPMEIER